MKKLGPFVKGFIKLTKSRTASIRKNVVKIEENCLDWP